MIAPNINNNFNNNIVKEIKRIELIFKSKFSRELSSPEYIDLTSLKTYTIDDSDANEVDDALSYEIKDSNPIFWIHIACPAELIKIDSCLEKQAYKKASTIYSIDNVDYMFPKEFINNYFSLLIGQRRICLSLRMELKTNYSINKFSFHKTIIKNSIALSYNDADEILDYQPKEEYQLLAIEKITNKHFQHRQDNGAITLLEPQGYITLKGSSKLLKKRVATPSRRLISESMIIYCNFFAKFCKERDIPVPYRNQSSNSLNNNVENNNYTDIHVSNFIKKKSFAKITLDIKAKGHYSLGLNQYVQSSSPLRRYIDYLSQYQLICYLNNEDSLSEQTIVERIKGFQSKQRDNIVLTRNNNKLLMLNWVKQNPRDFWYVIFMAWLNKKNSIALLYFKELSYDLSCSLESFKSVELGDEFKIKIQFINTDLDICKTKYISN